MKLLRKSVSNFLFILVSSFYFPVSTFAQSTWSARCQVNDVATIQGFECLFANVLKVIVSLAGIAFLVMFINGGFQYLFSSGDDKKAAAAASTLTTAFMGLIGAIASFLILRFIYAFTGIPVTQFTIPGP